MITYYLSDVTLRDKNNMKFYLPYMGLQMKLAGLHLDHEKRGSFDLPPFQF